MIANSADMANPTHEDADRAIRDAHRAMNAALGIALIHIANGVREHYPDAQAIRITTTWNDSVEDYTLDPIIQLDNGAPQLPLPEPTGYWTQECDLDETDRVLYDLLGDLSFLISPLPSDVLYIVSTRAPVYFRSDDNYDEYRATLTAQP